MGHILLRIFINPGGNLNHLNPNFKNELFFFLIKKKEITHVRTLYNTPTGNCA